MRFWWVSQNETYHAEAGGGYMWSPKVNKNGAKNPHYDFMTQVRPGDLIFSFAQGKIKSLGVALTEGYSSNKPIVDFGNKGLNWNVDGWRVDVDYRTVRQEISPSQHIEKIRTYLPVKYSPLQFSGKGNQAYLFEINSDLANLLLDLVATDPPEYSPTSLDEIVFNSEDQEIVRDESLRETQKSSLVQARRGQGLFRSRVKIIESFCRVTGVQEEKLLIASHVKPWRDSSNDERLNGNNGLFLSPHVDKLFNDGLITFDKGGSMEVSGSLGGDVLRKWSIDPRKKYGKFNTDQSYFLEFHNVEVYQG